MKKYIIGILIIFLAAGVVLYWQWPRTEPSEDIVRIGYNVGSINHGPIMVAADAGIFQKHGLQVKLVPLQSGKEVQQALALGKIDIGSGGATNFFIPIAKGAPLRIVAALTSSPTQLFVDPAGGLKTLQDLVGKTVASRKGSSSNLAFGRVLLQENIEIASIKMIDVENELAPMALMNKKIVAAAVAGEYQDKTYTDLGAVPLADWVTKGYSTQTAPRTVIAATTDFIDAHAKTMGRFIDAYIDSHRYIKDHPTEAARIISEHIQKGSGWAIQFPVSDVIDSWKTVKYDLWIEPDEFTKIAQVAKDIGDIDTTLTADQFMSLKYADALRHAQEEI